MFMRIFGTPQQEVFHRFALVAACWTSSTIDLLEMVAVSRARAAVNWSRMCIGGIGRMAMC